MNTVYQLNHDVVLQTVKQPEGDEGLLLRLMTEEYFSLSATAMRIVQELLKNQDEGQVTAILAAEYEVAGDEIAPQVSELVIELQEANLIGEVCCTGGACC